MTSIFTTPRRTDLTIDDLSDMVRQKEMEAGSIVSDGAINAVTAQNGLFSTYTLTGDAPYIGADESIALPPDGQFYRITCKGKEESKAFWSAFRPAAMFAVDIDGDKDDDLAIVYDDGHVELSYNTIKQMASGVVRDENDNLPTDVKYWMEDFYPELATKDIVV